MSKKYQVAISNDFMYCVDNRHSKSSINRSKFWKDLHVERAQSEEAFEVFLETDPPILIITGHVGSGKSTFIRSMLEKKNKFDGIIIDLSTHTKKFKNDSLQSISLVLEKLIFDVMFSILIYNYKYYFIKNEIEAFSEGDIVYNPDIDINDISTKKWKNYKTVNTAKRILSKDIILLMQDNQTVNSISNKHVRSEDEKDVEQSQEQLILNTLLKNKSIINELFKGLSYLDLIDFYRLIFDTSKEFIIVFDNIDAIPLIEIKSYFIEALIRIENEINGRSDGVFSYIELKPIKIALTIRDENISRLNINGAAAKEYRQIKLSNSDYSIPDISDPIELEGSEEFYYEILKNRIEYIEEKSFKTAVSIFKKITKNYWLDESNKSVKYQIGSLDIRSLTNDSIRLMLNLSKELSFYLYDGFRSKSLCFSIFDDAEFINNVNGKVYSYLFNHTSSKNLFQKFTKNLVNESNNVFCCNLRVCLTFLHNVAQSEYISFSFLYDNLRKIFQIEEKELKDIIYELYLNKGFKESDLITVYQSEIIESSEKIQYDSLIRINKKGSLFLEKILINMNYFFVVLRENNSDRSIFELHPDEAYKKINTIYQFVKKISRNHIKFIEEKFDPLLKNGKLSKEWYKKNFLISKTFYIQRVCDNHVGFIKTYLQNIFTINAPGFILSDKLAIVFNEFKEKNRIDKTYLADIELDSFISNLNLPPNSSVSKLYKLIKKYEELSTKHKNLW